MPQDPNGPLFSDEELDALLASAPATTPAQAPVPGTPPPAQDGFGRRLAKGFTGEIGGMLPVTAEGGLDWARLPLDIASLHPIVGGLRALDNAPAILDHLGDVAGGAISGDPEAMGQGAALAALGVLGKKAYKQGSPLRRGITAVDDMAMGAGRAALGKFRPNPAAAAARAADIPAVMQQAGPTANLVPVAGSTPISTRPPAAPFPTPTAGKPQMGPGGMPFTPHAPLSGNQFPEGIPAHFNPEAPMSMKGWYEGLGSEAGRAQVLEALGIDPTKLATLQGAGMPVQAAAAAPVPTPTPAPKAAPPPTPTPQAAPAPLTQVVHQGKPVKLPRVEKNPPKSWDEIADPADGPPAAAAEAVPNPSTAKLLDEGRRLGIVPGGTAAPIDEAALLADPVIAEFVDTLKKRGASAKPTAETVKPAGTEALTTQPPKTKGTGATPKKATPAKKAAPNAAPKPDVEKVADIDQQVKVPAKTPELTALEARARAVLIDPRGQTNAQFKRLNVHKKINELISKGDMAELAKAVDIAERYLDAMTGKKTKPTS